jgi:hypothetical protein
MKCVVYSTRLSFDKTYTGQDDTILEIWIENLGICFNERNVVYKSTSPRTAINHFGTFNLPDSFCDSVKTYLESKEHFETNNQTIFKGLKTQLLDRKSKHNKITG